MVNNLCVLSLTPVVGPPPTLLGWQIKNGQPGERVRRRVVAAELSL